jgi:hypothetical protein
MDFRQLYIKCTTEFEEGFAKRTAEEIIDAKAIDAFMELLDYAVSNQRKEGKLCFRAFYVLEAIYLYPYFFTPTQKYTFYTWLPLLKNRSAHRHIAKIMCLEFEASTAKDLLKLKVSESELLQCIENLAGWLIDEQSKVAVQIWSLEAMLRLRKTCVCAPEYAQAQQLLQEILPTCMELFVHTPTPGKQSRIRQWTESGLL